MIISGNRKSPVEEVRGSLLLVATPRGTIGDISDRAKVALREADLICCEDTRHTGQLLKRLGITPAKLMSLNAHNEVQRSAEITMHIADGASVVLVSDAGTPVISDPGERLVGQVIRAGQPLTMIPGPSAVIMALCLSGLPADRFSFEGFLPRKGPSRRTRIRRVVESEVTSVMYESPLRIQGTLQDLYEHCGGHRQISLARELTKIHEQIWRGTLEEAIGSVDLVLKGEFVIVVGPKLEHEPASRDENADAASRLVAAGLSSRDAASALEVLLGISHRAAYDAVLKSTVPAD